jgi:hypothetical protein
MNAPEFKTLADPMFQSIFNKGELSMNAESNAIDCQTGEERPSTTIITSTPQTGQPVPNQPVQGVSGNTYAPMDTTPKPPISRLDELTTLLNETLKQLVIELTNSKDQQTNLEEAVSVSLEQADWFRHRVEEATSEHIDNMDLDYEIGNSVEHYMRHQFDVTDHVDFSDLVNDRVDDVIEDIVSEKVEEAVEARLADLLEEKLANANITINF